MSGNDETFRVNVRFNRVEYAELDRDLSRYTGANKGARIRMLMRLGLQVATGNPPPLAGASEPMHLASVVDFNRHAGRSVAATHVDQLPVRAKHPSGHSADPAAEGPKTQSTSPSADSLDALTGTEFDPAHFHFGGPVR